MVKINITALQPMHIILLDAMPDMVCYNNFFRDNIGALAYVVNIQSFLVLNQSKAETAYALEFG
ncbi:hypothetical protein IM793_14165 [Pedobacter sp. MR2016-19]|uniref:hypothetical protein n=1 Tax=Pedobacter sp. MR2016-19 TaxID=2780089 RepID=UPI001875DA1A|nr:hypothetical protein [Pedobacter sp. MR2016-19]MBE5320306.1 hypothetical protein [Pedobacter sp. MR2016-19]